MDSWERMIIQTGKPRAMRTATVVEDHDKQCYDFYLRIETLRIAIENDIDATSPRGGNDTMLGSKVDSYDGHDDRSIFFSNNNKMTSLSAMIIDWCRCRKCCGCGCVCVLCVRGEKILLRLARDFHGGGIDRMESCPSSSDLHPDMTVTSSCTTHNIIITSYLAMVGVLRSRLGVRNCRYKYRQIGYWLAAENLVANSSPSSSSSSAAIAMV